ncbi:MAG: A/G-specific adenine glycosylase [Rhodospirillales bacterium]|nr:A/G-specific adenine glycosylase [Rhodospirillales bacterium]
MAVRSGPDANHLLAWFKRHRRDLPWRGPWGGKRDPYRVWLSEIMLQQTQAAAVVPRYRAFLDRWPTVGALARAEEREVLDAWAGLGYYRRARNLHRAAQVVVAERDGRFPGTVRDLQSLPGVGAYTAAAIAALAFGVPAVAVDGNVARVLARVFAIPTPVGRASRQLQAIGAELAPESLPGEFAEALIELGALVCRPRQPRCRECPWQHACEAFRTGRTAELPVVEPRVRPALRYSAAFRLTNRRGEVLLRRQTGPGPFHGMLVLPATPWANARPSDADIQAAAPGTGGWQRIDGLVEHGLTHLTLRTELFAAATTRKPAAGEIWHAGLGSHQDLPAYTRKLLEHGESSVRQVASV